MTRAIYLAVLSASEPSPFLPETGDEAVAAGERRRGAAGGCQAGGRREAHRRQPTVRVDVAGIGQRILALAVPAARLQRARAGRGRDALLRGDAAGAGRRRSTVHRYQLRERRAAPFLEGVRSYTLSADTKRLLYRADGNRWGIVPTDRPAKVGEGAIDVGTLEALVDPRAEWAQIFRETWRIQREYFYDPSMHGADWQAVSTKSTARCCRTSRIAPTWDISIATVGGELAVGHSYLTGRRRSCPATIRFRSGMLGADYAIENGRYRIKKIYSGENWNPELQAPLSGPGIQVSEGDYLLEVNGRPLAPPTSVYQLFEGTAGKQTLLRVNSSPSLEGSRLVTVVPVASDEAPAHARVDRGQSPARGQAVGRPAGVRLAAEHRRPGIHRVQPLLLRAAGQGRARSSTSATTRAGWSPTTSSTS